MVSGLQVAGCVADMEAEKGYNQKKRCCAAHMRADAVMKRDTGNKLFRYCFQCGKLESLSRFDGAHRSCRDRLVKRKERQAALKPAGPPNNLMLAIEEHGVVFVDNDEPDIGVAGEVVGAHTDAQATQLAKLLEQELDTVTAGVAAWHQARLDLLKQQFDGLHSAMRQLQAGILHMQILQQSCPY
eukprot:gene11954-12097_t